MTNLPDASPRYALATGLLVFIPVVGWALIPLVQLAALVVWIVLMVKAYQGEWFQLPVVGGIAAKQVGGIDIPPSAS